MAESEATQALVNQAAIKAAITAAMALVMVLGEAGVGPRSAENTISPREVHRQRHGSPALKQLLLNWNATEKYVELLNFEMEVTNILQMKACELNEEGKVPIIKI